MSFINLTIGRHFFHRAFPTIIGVRFQFYGVLLLSLSFGVTAARTEAKDRFAQTPPTNGINHAGQSTGFLHSPKPIPPVRANGQAKGKLPIVRFPKSPSPYCQGTYASDLLALSSEARQLEEKTRYTFCVRSTASYQCMYYGLDGSLQSRKETRIAHGTAFAFRREGNITYLMTNEHVTEWPYVTSKENTVHGVPNGCKRINQTVSIVDDEQDSYSKDDITLQRMVVDPELDIAILKAPIKVEAIPFNLGQSAALSVGDSVRVRGFPLGAFQAVHGGRVISTREPDREGRWDHLDFVIDAQLSTGNSGSPILAVSCATRKFELVGIYHAGYRSGQSLNVAVGIDEFRELLATLKPRKHKKSQRMILGMSNRAQLISDLKNKTISPQFPFGGYVGEIRVADSRLLYDFYPKKFPLVDWRMAVIEDLPSDGFGRIGRIWFGNENGLLEKNFSDLKPLEQNAMIKLIDEIRFHFLLVTQYRRYEPLSRKSRLHYEKLRGIEREMSRGQAERQSQIRALAELASQYGPDPDTKSLPLSVTALPPSPIKLNTDVRQVVKKTPIP